MTAAASRGRPRGSFRSLRHANYRRWFAGAIVSNVGTWMQRTAQSWLVLTQLTHHDARALGVVSALQFGPQFALLPWTGHAADHLDRRRLLMATQAALGLFALGLGLLTVAGVIRLWEVYGFALLSGAAAAFDAPVRQTFVGELVGDEDLANAVALNSTSFNAARMVGPAVAGLCIGVIGTGWAFVVNGLSFLAVLASLATLRQEDLHGDRRRRPAPGGLLAGFRYVAAQPDLRAVAVMLFLIGTLGFNFPIFISTMAVGVFHTDAAGFGLLNSAMAVGTFAGAFIATGRERPRFATLTAGAALFGVGCAAAAVAPGYWPFAAALAVTGLATLTFTNTSNALMQLRSDPAMRGRVMAIRLAIALGTTPLGAPLVGWIARDWGPRWALGSPRSRGCWRRWSACAISARPSRRSRRMAHEQPIIPTADGECPCHLFTPADGQGPWPAVILYMDAGGIRPAVIDMARRLAENGYVALLPDLFYRYGPYGPFVPKEVFAGDARAVLGPLVATTGNDKAAGDTGAFLDFLDGRDDVAERRVGAVGFCMGGGMAIAAAATWPDRFAAVASFHGGRLATDAATSPHLLAPRLEAELYIAAAQNDASYPPDMAARFEAALDAAGVRYRAETYPAAHGWMKPDFPVYDEAEAERGWAAMLGLFDRTLRRG